MNPIYTELARKYGYVRQPVWTFESDKEPDRLTKAIDMLQKMNAAINKMTGQK